MFHFDAEASKLNKENLKKAAEEFDKTKEKELVENIYLENGHIIQVHMFNIHLMAETATATGRRNYTSISALPSGEPCSYCGGSGRSR